MPQPRSSILPMMSMSVLPLPVSMPQEVKMRMRTRRRNRLHTRHPIQPHHRTPCNIPMRIEWNMSRTSTPRLQRRTPNAMFSDLPLQLPEESFVFPIGRMRTTRAALYRGFPDGGFPASSEVLEILV
ncbi:hypothetical protein SAICODRAFT_32137 [Saitoella complicata NRRL Y-17804]|uniref:uncharacterized protein n=1 Tax=Saitoella complicata (strain BCRC 22490 / CBS 7301 / JCM 7358 / NBRC 10748 / NRRL Y-17804) TaxID=698492 RepID=UPI0008670C89|nr:uncharacterized protein SAICODRAFT_32137 [Saitoella complicata NRRL Y-17804]ODQ49975.1 hypothetical protein SAICODRAFT_32137 [Saitoella complicata NRRL Y-17804]